MSDTTWWLWFIASSVSSTLSYYAGCLVERRRMRRAFAKARTANLINVSPGWESPERYKR
jgi:hypothetical protein